MVSIGKRLGGHVLQKALAEHTLMSWGQSLTFKPSTERWDSKLGQK